jgi:hypothetical protein
MVKLEKSRTVSGRIPQGDLNYFKVFYESISQVHGFYSAEEFFLKGVKWRTE